MNSGISAVPLEYLYTQSGKRTEVFSQHALPSVEGVVATGGLLTHDLLIEAYSKGIFPWYNEPPVQWFSPHERLVLYLDEFCLSRSFRKWCRTEGVGFKHRTDTAFPRVMKTCATVPRKNQDETTWINTDMLQAYQGLHEVGLAHSVEIWGERPASRLDADATKRATQTNVRNEKISEQPPLTEDLIGGLYGVSLGRIFFGESMFSKHPNTSKLALGLLCQFLREFNFMFIDCQVVTEHMLSLGARVMKRHDFMQALQVSNDYPTLKGSWREAWRSVCGERVVLQDLER